MLMDTDKDIMGTGWAYPLHPDGRGGIALSRHENDIEESIRIILSTAKGERRMRPNFGCDIHIPAANTHKIPCQGHQRRP
jgi:hypothetical protein